MLKLHQAISILPDRDKGFWELAIVTAIDVDGEVDCVYFENRQPKKFSFYYQGFEHDKQVRV